MHWLQTSLTITKHSLYILRSHPRLLLFPLIAALALAIAFELFFQFREQTTPLHWMLNAALGSREQQDIAYVEMYRSLGQSRKQTDMSFAVLVTWYLSSTFVATFVNAALYSQAIAAMNGDKVSVSRGFLLACRKLPAIAAWSLLAGTVGVALRMIQDRVGFLWRWIATLTGLTWSVASVFVIPVILNEPRAKSPFEYLRISTSLLRRAWGEGAIGISGAWLLGTLVVIPLVILGSILTFAAQSFLPITLALLTCSIVVALLLFAYQIFACGLYVYSTQGVAPGTFDAEFLERVWEVK